MNNSLHTLGRSFTAALGLCLWTALASTSSAQTHALEMLEVEYAADTGIVRNESTSPQIIASFVVDVPGAPWVRLDLDGTILGGDVFAGTGTTLRIQSLFDGALQTMNARHLEQWQNSSAYFNGDSVLVEVLAEPQSGDNRVVVTGVSIGQPPAPQESQCGTTDDRVPSSDPRACRIVPIGCTGWLIDDCQHCFLTAGHCSGLSLQTAQFNVPLSDPNTGANMHPGPQDQYPIDLASVQSNGGQGTGNDWAYYGTFANSTTGMTAFQTQGQTYLVSGQTLPAFNSGDSIRITGYGSDFNDNQFDNVQQTHAGPWVTFSGTLIQYATDTEGGNSGSGVEHEATGIAIGIHTHAGCNSTGGQNQGTALTHPDLQNALANPTGICAAGIQPTDLPTAIQPGIAETITAVASGNVALGSATLWWRLDGGAFQSQVMTDQGGGNFQASLTALTCDDTPEFYFSADIVGCGTVTSPSGAPTATYSTLVGTEVSILVDDFETDMGWTVNDDPGLTTGTWERVLPNFSNRGDPPNDADGSGMCFVTDNATNEDVDNGTTFLTSASMDLTGGALISYAYWCNSTSDSSFGLEDFLRVEVATDAGGTNWTLLRDHGTIEGTWRRDTIAVGTEVPATSTVRIRFSMADLSPGDIVEGGIDDVEIFSLDCAGSPFFCDGNDGSLASCPCGNTGDPLSGCDIAQGTGGVLLDVAEQSTSPQNRATMVGTGFPGGTFPSAVAIRAAQLDSNAPVVFGDGLRCVGSSVVRLGATTAVAGVSQHTFGHGAGPGAGTFYYQLWFRNTPISFCDPTAAFNLSNGRSLDW